MIRRLFGRPYLDLTRYLDAAALCGLDEEICAALSQLDTTYTGGSHKWMGIVPPSLGADAHADYGEVIAGMSRDQFAAFVALSDTPDEFDLDRQADYEFGEERDWALNKRQMHYLEYRYGVYFPWKVFYELIPNERWDERAHPEGKSFTDEARRLLPRTVAFVEALPFAQLGRCNLLGLRSHDHGTVHRDGHPSDPVGHFITLCPRANKRLFLWDEQARREIFVEGQACWFDDYNYHGVAADPWFRYSIRVDGVFAPEFLASLHRDFA
jgi:hypothetical protein